ncbi:MAG: cupin domain-containing protein [Candidatus Omnitrophica bacterium]|nr:cupin domain-containing protein [Candidatus Omnitrophota bacterium]
MRRLAQVLATGWVVLALGGVWAAEEAPVSMPATDGPMFVRAEELKWERMFPEFGEGSPEIAILRTDPQTQATQLMIRAPKGFHVPKHWHTANETHTVLSGRFVMECDGKRAELGPGSFNYVPSKMIHEAWTPPDSGALLFITTDRAWDINWVEGPPKPSNQP